MLSRPRGQALLETVIALPLFLLSLFGIMWAVHEVTLAERTQLGVRYAGVVGAASQPYNQYSLDALYRAAVNSSVTPTARARRLFDLLRSDFCNA